MIMGLDGLHIWASFGFDIGCQHQIQLGSQVDVLYLMHTAGHHCPGQLYLVTWKWLSD